MVLLEQVEDLIEHLWRDAHALVLDPDSHRRIIFESLERDARFLVAVLGGIGQQVRDYLREPGRVGVDEQAMRRNVDRQCLALLFEQWADHLDRPGGGIRDFDHFLA